MRYIDYYVEHDEMKTTEGHPIKVLELKIPSDESIINEWAIHLRNHYCNDSEIDLLRSGYGYTREEYLNNIKFPSRNESLGPATRSGDFTEILIADYLEFIEGYYVPRTRYDRKITKNSSSQGSDLIAFKIGYLDSSNDELVIYEVKAQTSNTAPKNRLQDAIIDSRKDIKRLAESLNAINQRLIDKGEYEKSSIIRRFQNSTDRPYCLTYGAAAVHSTYSFSGKKVQECSISAHPEHNVKLIVIYSEKFMEKIHDIYWRATQC